MKKPMTTEELFNKIKDILKEKGRLPDILGYGLATHCPAFVTTYGFDLGSRPAYGGNEGIYLNLWIGYFANREKQRKGLGTFKTLNTGSEAVHTMAGLLADFTIEEYAYVNASLDDFTWEGADADAFDAEGKLRDGHTCSTMEAALNRKNELLKRYPQAVARNNAAGKEKMFGRENQEIRYRVILEGSRMKGIL